MRANVRAGDGAERARRVDVARVDATRTRRSPGARRTARRRTSPPARPPTAERQHDPGVVERLAQQPARAEGGEQRDARDRGRQDERQLDERDRQRAPAERRVASRYATGVPIPTMRTLATAFVRIVTAIASRTAGSRSSDGTLRSGTSVNRATSGSARNASAMPVASARNAVKPARPALVLCGSQRAAASGRNRSASGCCARGTTARAA